MTPPSDAGPIRLLVADPLPLFSDSLAISLALESDLAVLEERPTNGPATVDAIVRLKADVALVDFWMPDMEGPAITSAALEAAPGCKTILFFWMTSPPHIHQALEAAPAGFISKEGSVKEVADVVRRVHGGETPYYDPRLDYLIRAGSFEAAGDWQTFKALTPRQIEILALLNLGLSTRQVASRLEISPKTVRNLISQMLVRVGAQSSTEALARARAAGFFRS